MTPAVWGFSPTPGLFETVAEVFGNGGWIRGLHPCEVLPVYVVGRDVDIDTTFLPDNSSVKASQASPPPNEGQPANAKDPVALRFDAIVATPRFALEQHRFGAEATALGITLGWYDTVGKAVDDSRCVGRDYVTTLHECDEFPNRTMTLAGSTFFNGTARPADLDGANLGILSRTLNRREGSNYQRFLRQCPDVNGEANVEPESRLPFIVVAIPGANLAPPSFGMCRTFVADNDVPFSVESYGN